MKTVAKLDELENFGLEVFSLGDGFLVIETPDDYLSADLPASVRDRITARKLPQIDRVLSVTPRQFRQALNAAGLRANVEGIVASQSQDVKDWWEFASSFDRDHPLVVQFGAALGQTPEQLNDLFSAAGAL
jgi:hypothetical protein